VPLTRRVIGLLGLATRVGSDRHDSSEERLRKGDLWGDAVNMASRMESHGVPGEIQITRATWELIRGEFECRARGTVDVKGKGHVEA
jgi:class 3 adenylate cyclase